MGSEPAVSWSMVMWLDVVEQCVGWAGALAAGLTLGVVLIGLRRSRRRLRGRATGWARKVLTPAGYFLIGLGFFGACVLLWRPIPLFLSPWARGAALIVGAALLFPGLGLVLWARLVLGEMYNVSSSLGAELYADHRLITHGPYAIVRHPIYLGLESAALGGLLIYRTWTTLFLALVFVGLVLRAWREERVLAAEFGEQWQAYCRQVPGWLPRRLTRRRD